MQRSTYSALMTLAGAIVAMSIGIGSPYSVGAQSATEPPGRGTVQAATPGSVNNALPFAHTSSNSPSRPGLPNLPGLLPLPDLPTLPPIPGTPQPPGAIPPIVVTNVSPPYGPAAGGTRITFTGTGFSTAAGATHLAAGQYQFTDVSCTSTTTCTAITPPVDVEAGSAEIANSISVTVNDQTTANQELIFVWFGTPRLESISPSSGPATGGTVVTLIGSLFPVTGQNVGSVSVIFGTTPTTGVTCSYSDKCTATAPAGSGTVQVTVTTPGGTSNSQPFTYTASTDVLGRPIVPSLPLPTPPIPTIPLLPVPIPRAPGVHGTS